VSDYASIDGRVRIVSIRKRAPWHRQTNRRGGLYTMWSAWDIQAGRWIAEELPTLGSIKRRLVEAGYGESAYSLRRV
jgi:hypothetical protein